MPNRLADESSPYLLQHRENPVDWYPWGPEAFEKAEAEDKPVFLSVGYSTCHWCHVMERESFEDEEVAQLMNEALVAIKVDREERPDIDQLYMQVCQLMTRQGGWPLNVFLTPDREAFHAETYIPKTGRFGRMGMRELIPRIRQLWEGEREKVLESARSVTSALRQAAEERSAGETLGEDTLQTAYDALSRQFDAAQGGFGKAPKFPAPHNLLFLLRQGRFSEEARAFAMVEKTLDRMRLGGIFDHVGFGFHRYSTDERWLVPHFEKMLYDQALLAMAYTEGYQALEKETYRQTAEQVFTYVLRDLQAPDGGFYSAEDADSEGEEGKFYVWTTKELRKVLGEDRARRVIEVYNLEEDGNVRDESTGQKTGKNILHLRRPLDELAEASGEDKHAFREELEAARRKLFERREERPRPGLDDKVLTDWNGLMIAALAKAARAFEAPRYAAAAEKAAAFLLETLRDTGGRLLHRYRDGRAGIRAHLDDYAFLAWGLTELYEATFDSRWLRSALELADEMRAHFADEETGGFYLTADDGEELLVRQKSFHDAAMPSGNAGALLALLRLGHLTGRTELAQEASRLVEGAAASVGRQPDGHTALLCGLRLALGPAREVVIAGDPEAEDTRAMLRVLRRTYTPEAVTLLRPPGQAPPITEWAPFTATQGPRNGTARAYVCTDHTCRAPVTDPEEMLQALQQ